MKRLIVFLTALLVVGHLGINVVGLPPLLVAENLVLAAAYAVLAILLWRRWGVSSLAALLVVATFNAGRVSRSVWSPTTGWGALAVEHIPLLIYLIAVSLLAAAALVRLGR
ncbi:MAG: hypothetical protein ABWK05_06945 [Pyrobaculum sp.]